jgi:2-amino-4-hydroxy-6-hydroxymethyldihydropteridine diphosphokinase
MKNRVLLSLGSNIHPEKNIPCAVSALENSPELNIIGISSVWQTKAVGINSADFYNLAILAETELDASSIKQQVLRCIEKKLERVRQKDKFAPRTIDIDIAIFNDQLIDQNVFRYDYLYLPLAELVPHFSFPGQPTLSEIAEKNVTHSPARRLEGLLAEGAKWPC